MKPIKLFLVFFITILSTGCATLHLKSDYRAMGEYNPERDNAVQKRFLELRDAPPEAFSEIKVLVDSIPKGIEIKGNVITVVDGYQHQILGKFGINPDSGVFPNYKTTWRKYYCYPQIPLVYITFATWFGVPIYYPCFSTVFSPKTEIVAAVKKLVMASGGDIAVITFYGTNLKDRDKAMGVGGFILKSDPRFKNKKLETAPQKLEKIPISI